MSTQELKPVRISYEINGPARFRRYAMYMSDDYTSEYWETWEVPEFPESPEDKFVEIVAGLEGLHGIALLAYEFYGRPDLWFILAAVNGVEIPSRDLKVGVTLRVPPISDVLSKLI